MKKLIHIWITLIFALSLASFALGQEKAKKVETAPASKPAPEKATEVVKPEAAKPQEAKEKPKAEEKKPVAEKPRIWRAGGMVTAVDMKTLTLSVHQETVKHDRVLKLKVSKKIAKELGNLKPGDLVNVWLSGTTATALNKVN